MTREQMVKLSPGDQVFVEGVSGLGEVLRLTGNWVIVQWEKGVGTLYPEPHMVPNISRLHRVGGDPA